ncbi:hypothetical protein JCM10450v2_002588 [Rhodotorula kratochvilovae]
MPSLRLLTALTAAAAATLANAATCVPTLPANALLNVFSVGRSTGVWEYVPPAREPAATSGGGLFLSWTDTAENGAFYVQQRATVDGTGEAVWTLSLGSHDAGVQCVTAQGKNGAATTGGCDDPEAEFALSCQVCPTPPSGAESGPGQCLTSVSGRAAGRSTPRIETRQCKGTRGAGQVWDLRLA